MGKVNEQDLALGGVYAAALWEVASAQGLTDEVLDEVLDFAAYWEGHPEFASFLASPTIDVGIKRSLIEKLLRGKYGDVLVDALQVINRNGRLGQFPAIAEAYRRLHEDQTGRVEALVRTAHPLTEALRERLREVVSKRTGRRVDIVEKQDDSLIGGLVVRIKDDRFDMSVARRLQAVYHMLLERASREIRSHRARVIEDAL